MSEHGTDIAVRQGQRIPQWFINAMCLTYVALAFLTGHLLGIFIFVIYVVFLGLLFLKRG
jgi:hypothetical protein